MRSSELCRKAREAKGIKQADIALQAGLSRPALARFETDSLMLSEDKLFAVAKLLDINPDYFSGITRNAFKNQNGELIRFFVDKNHVKTDLLITLAIAGSEIIDMYALSPPLTVLERIRKLNLAGNPLYAIVMKDDHDNVFLFRCKSNRDFMGNDNSVTARFMELANMTGKRGYLESQIITKNLYEKIREWDNVTKADFDYLLHGKENEIGLKTLVLNDAEKILINVMRDCQFDATDITQLLKCIADSDCHPVDVTRILRLMQGLQINPAESIQLLTEHSHK